MMPSSTIGVASRLRACSVAAAFATAERHGERDLQVLDVIGVDVFECENRWPS